MKSSRPMFLMVFFQVLAVLGILPFLFNTADILLHPLAAPLDPSFGPTARVFFGLLAAPLTLVIAILCIRRASNNIVGWALVSFSYGQSIQVFRDGLLPLAPAVFSANLFIGQFWFSFLILPFYFPDGQLFPPVVRRWGDWIVTFTLIFVSLFSNLSNSILSWGGEDRNSIPNPLQVFNLDIRPITIPCILILIVTGIVTVVLRYRASRGVERLQMRWLLFGVLLQAVATFLSLLVQVPAELSFIFSLGYALIIPVAVGIAVLRYRLYDIDIIIRRTLQYGLLTVLLGGVYFGLVLLLGQALLALTGKQSPLVIVLSTLAIAALFNPFRRRIQLFIDRRFFRARYDANRTAAAFSDAARRQVEPGALAEQLATAARDALQPEGAWVWIRKDNRQDVRRNSE